jgi:molecular chaperone DnaJ
MNLDFDPKKNYYEILGIAEDANEDDIKKAYRKAAMQHHPDRNKDNPGAEDKFKEANEANEVLSNPQKRQQYDAFRKGGYWAGWFGGFWWGWGFGWFNGGQVEFGDLGDLLGGFFWWGFGGWGWRGPAKGDDLMLQLTLSFEDAYHGIEKEISYQRMIPAEWVTTKPCPHCDGRGVVMQQARTVFGVMQTQAACPDCQGAGQEYYKDDKKIAGGGLEQHTENLTVKVPAGIKTDSKIRYGGKWNAGMLGWPAWDLYIRILVKQSEKRRRDGDNMIMDIDVSIYEAVLGGEQKIAHPDGEIKVSIPKWLQVGESIRVGWKWFGEKSTRWGRKGDLIVIPKIKIPKKLSKEQEKLWKELGKE